MKTIILAITVLGSLAFAGQENAGFGGPNKLDYQPAQIFTALNVEAVEVNSGFAGIRKVEKSVGGLVCSREVSAAITAKTKFVFECHIEQENIDYSAIYAALNLKEVKQNSSKIGVATFVKSIGGLTCVRSTTLAINVKSKNKYACKMIGE